MSVAEADAAGQAPSLFDDALGELRTARRRRRTAEMEWFEVAYRVYLVALAGGGLVAWLSGMVRDTTLDATELADVRRYGPALGGLLGALAILLGLRSGARGGPLAVEAAEIRHVLLAPVSRARALRRPAWQRTRAVLAAGALSGAIAGQLAGRRIGSPLVEWILSGIAAGVVLGALFVATSFAAHALRMREWQASVLGAGVVAVEVAAITRLLPAGPLDSVGSLALWPLRVRPLDAVVAVAALGALGACFSLLERMSLELMSRRTALVAQLRFAVTMQDVRTVMLLRRQLSLEQTREHPWFPIPPWGSASWRRAAHSIARFPARRLGRMALLAAIAGLACVGAYRGTSPLFLVGGLCTFLIGLDALEPLAQALDHPDLVDGYPHEPGRLHRRLLPAPALLTIAVALVGVATAVGARPAASTLVVGLLFGVPMALVGLGGAALNTIAGAPDPFATGAESNFLPPEVAGLHLAARAVWPLAVAVAGSAPVLLIRHGVALGDAPAGLALRVGLGELVVVGAIGWWVERRLAFRRWWKNMLEQGKAERRAMTGRQR